MKFVFTILIILFMVGLVVYIFNEQSKSLYMIKETCRKHQMMSSYDKMKLGRIYTNSGFCVDPKTNAVYLFND